MTHIQNNDFFKNHVLIFNLKCDKVYKKRKGGPLNAK